ncbi:MAG: dATP pyrophosphohydrolase, partial [Caldimonas sp.]
HAEARFWLARRDGRDVGRISAQIDRLVKDPEIGHFGMIAAEDRPEVFAALFAAAEGWLRERGKTRVLGPFNLSINEESGLLVDGFDTPPMLLMGHDARHIAGRIEALGYAKAKDLIAYIQNTDDGLFPESARRFAAKRMPKNMTLRNLDPKRYREEFDTVTEIFNDAWSENWGFLAFTEAEIAHMAKSLKPLIKPEYVVIVEVAGRPIGFGIALPNLNELIADFNGRLLPFNWLKLLLRLKRGATTARVPLMGIRRTYSGGLIGGLAPILIVDTLRKAMQKDGIRDVEMSWILEDNRPMRHMIESLGGRPYKTYRVYEKRLGSANASHSVDRP